MKIPVERLNQLFREAINEASRSVHEDNRPHPRVGAILTDFNGRILAKAYRGERLGAHAEFSSY